MFKEVYEEVSIMLRKKQNVTGYSEVNLKRSLIDKYFIELIRSEKESNKIRAIAEALKRIICEKFKKIRIDELSAYEKCPPGAIKIE